MTGDRAVFLHLFAKNRTSNLTESEEDTLRKFEQEVAALTDGQLDALVEHRGWRKIDDVEPEDGIPE